MGLLEGDDSRNAAKTMGKVRFPPPFFVNTLDVPELLLPDPRVDVHPHHLLRDLALDGVGLETVGRAQHSIGLQAQSATNIRDTDTNRRPRKRHGCVCVGGGEVTAPGPKTAS